MFRINIKLLSNPVAELKIRENNSHCRSIVLKTMDFNYVIRANHLVSLITSSTTDPSSIKLHFFLNTGLIQPQGKSYDKFASQDFIILKYLTVKIQKFNTTGGSSYQFTTYWDIS
jgi:hypothetical protein